MFVKDVGHEKEQLSPNQGSRDLPINFVPPYRVPLSPLDCVREPRRWSEATESPRYVSADA